MAMFGCGLLAVPCRRFIVRATLGSCGGRSAQTQEEATAQAQVIPEARPVAVARAAPEGPRAAVARVAVARAAVDRVAVARAAVGQVLPHAQQPLPLPGPLVGVASMWGTGRRCVGGRFRIGRRSI